jgi:cellobiose phosphorylase
MSDYKFKNNGMDIDIKRMDLPYPWVNYLTNTNLSAMISQAGGGFLWHKSPVKLRITRYRYHQAPPDTPGFFVYIKEENGEVWCPTFQPFRDKKTERYSTHRPGETLFYAQRGDTRAVLSFFIPPDIDTLIWELTLTNESDVQKKYEVYAYTELAQFDWSLEQSLGYYWQHMLRTKYDAEREILFYTFNFVKDPFYHKHAPLVYFASDLPVKSFCGDRDAFIGNYRSEAEPIALERDTLGNEEIWSGNPCAVLQTEMVCGERESKTAHFFLGTSEGALVDHAAATERAIDTVKDLRSDGFVANQRDIMRARYDAHFSHFTCDIPDKDIQRQINIWGPLNAFQFSLFHQTPQPSAPGIRAIGARDKFQALMPISYRDAEAAKRGLLFMLSVQYENGCIRHDINGYMHEFASP